MQPVYLQGGAVHVSWADAGRSLTDLIFHGVSAALRDAGIGMQKIDSVVLSAHDVVDGRSLSSMVTAPAAGAYLRDEIRIVGDGMNAVSLGAARLVAGESELTMIAAWGRASEGDFTRTSLAMMDPFLIQPLAMTELDISALRLAAWLGRHPGRDAQRRKASADRRGRAAAAGLEAGDLIAGGFPLRADEGPRMADIVAAVVLGTSQTPFRIAGIGHSTETPALNARDFVAMSALAQAARGALSEAGIAAVDIGVAEIDGATLSDEAIGAEAIGLADPGEGFSAYCGEGRINASGGSAAGWCYPAMGLVRLVECRDRLKAKGKRGRGFGLSTGSSPLGGLAQTAIVLEAS